MSTNEEIGREAGRRAREKTLDLLESGVGPTLEESLGAIKDAHYAEDQDGAPDHRTRLKAASLGLQVWDAMPPKHVEASGIPDKIEITWGGGKDDTIRGDGA